MTCLVPHEGAATNSEPLNPVRDFTLPPGPGATGIYPIPTSMPSAPPLLTTENDSISVVMSAAWQANDPDGPDRYYIAVTMPDGELQIFQTLGLYTGKLGITCDLTFTQNVKAVIDCGE